MSLRPLLIASLLIVGCRGQSSTEPPIHPIRNMYDQPRYNVQGESRFFEDGRAMRPLVAGTVAREMEPELSIATGRLDDNSAWVLEVPPEVQQRFGGASQMIERGRQRFTIYCTPCHDQTGHSRGMVVRRGLAPPPSLHDPRIQHLPDGQVYATITNGIRTMPAYKHSVPMDDRWAIVSYVRALQLAAPEAPPALVMPGMSDGGINNANAAADAGAIAADGSTDGASTEIVADAGAAAVDLEGPAAAGGERGESPEDNTDAPEGEHTRVAPAEREAAPTEGGTERERRTAQPRAMPEDPAAPEAPEEGAPQ